MSLRLFSPVVMALAAAFIVFAMMTRGRKSMVKICLAVAFPAFVGGLTLYTIANMPESGNLVDTAIAVLRGLFSTGRMFFIEEDYSLFMDNPEKAWLVESALFQLAFWLCHVLALVVAASAVMVMFGRRLINSLSLRFRSYESCTIICGVDQDALVLGENILTHDGARDRPDPRRLVVYLAPEASEELITTIEELGGLCLEVENSNFAKQLRRAGLGASPGRIGSLQVILLSDEEAEVMSNLRTVLDSALAWGVAPQRLSVYVLSESAWARAYAQSLRDRPAEDGEGRTYPYPLHVAGESELAARRMVLALPPCGSISFKDGVARQDFTVLVLGFGKTGSQALLRLIMNGQFVGSRMRALVVDREVELLRGIFERTYPALSRCCEIEYHQLDVRSAEFFTLVQQQQNSIRYIVSALNDDALNLEISHLLVEQIRLGGEGLPHFALAISGGEGAGSELTENTVFFSRRRELYSEATVIREEIDRAAVAINTVYAQSVAEDNYRAQLGAWFTLDSFTHESNRAAADFIPTMLHLAQLTEEEATFRDRLTDRPELAEVLTETEHLRWNAFHFAMGYTPMSTEEMAARFNMLRAEGKDPTACRKDSVRKKHACLVPWEELVTVSDVYNQLLAQAGLSGERHFQREDRAIISNIPRFLRSKQGLNQPTEEPTEEEPA